MTAYLLDSNILSDIMRNPQGPAAVIFENKAFDSDARMVTSIVVACEMRYGVAKNKSAPLAQRVDRALASVEVIALAAGADSEYATIRADLERRGLIIGQNDMLIAAHALALDAILVTDNVREFKRVKGLKIENWLRSWQSAANVGMLSTRRAAAPAGNRQQHPEVHKLAVTKIVVNPPRLLKSSP